MDSAADAVGSFARTAALPMTVRLTDLTVDALTGTVTCASSWRGAEFASIAPRSQADVPSALPQPKLKAGAPALAGVAWSRTVASGTLPPVVHSLTVHRAACPRSLADWAGATLTQRLGWVLCATVLAPSRVLVAVAVAVLAGVALTMARVCVDDVVWRALEAAPAGALLVAAFVGVEVTFAVVFAAVGAGLDFSVRVGAGVAVWLVAVGVGVDGVGEPEAEEGGWLGGVAESGKGSQDSLLDVVAALAAVLAAKVRLAPDAAVTKTLPASSVTVAGRACAKRMKRPYQCCSSSRYVTHRTLSALEGATALLPGWR